jgi:TPR repeat protein
MPGWPTLRTECLCMSVCVVLATPLLSQEVGTPDGPAPRVALVIGNSAYSSVSALPNPANDAQIVAEKLWEAGFEVIESIDADRETMLADLATFESRLREGSEALFFYAGHGVQIDGRNWLLPVSVAPSSVEELKAQSVDAQLVVDVMANSGAKLNLILLDACRNNPFKTVTESEVQAIASRAITIGASAEEVSRGLTLLGEASAGGLAEMTAGEAETVISFATAPGSVALDGEGRHSPYTQALANNLSEPGLEIGDLFRRIRGEVREATAGSQITWTTSTLENRFYFKPPYDDLRASTTGMGIESDTLGTLPPRRVVDRAFWRAIRDSGRLDAFSAYIRTMPDGAFVPEAKARVIALGGDPDAIRISDTSLPSTVTRGLEVTDETARAEATESVDRADVVAAIGTGPVPVGVSAPVDGWLWVDDAPRLGVVEGPSDAEMQGGSVRWMTAGEQLAYEPKIGSNGGVDSLTGARLGADGASDPIAVLVETHVDACDMLAGNPYDSKRVTAGTRQFIIDRNFDAAIAACEIAVQKYPDVPRFWAQLARAYRSGQRYEEALFYQQKAVDAGYVSAMVYLGQMYLDAQAVPRDYAKAKKLFETAANLEETAAFTALAWIYRAGVGVDQDYGQALEYYMKGAERGNDWAMTNIGEFYQHGLGVERDPNEAVRWYTAGAKSGELTAQTRLARMYQTGDGIPKDFELARFWYETAASRGVPNALTRLGIMYEEGQGIEKDLEAAVRLYTRAAGEGDDEAYFRLGRVFASANPLFDDPARAAALLTRSVSGEVYGAARELGRLYEQGKGVPRSLARARELYMEAADGNPWAARDAGRAWASSDGVEPDMAEAIRWYRVALEGKVPWAALDLGKLAEAGRGMPQDRTEALVLFATARGLSEDTNLVEAVGKAASGYSDAEFAAAAQVLLTRLGAEIGPADGRLGPATRAALSEAFATRGLPAPEGPVDLDILARLSAME